MAGLPHDDELREMNSAQLRALCTTLVAVLRHLLLQHAKPVPVRDVFATLRTQLRVHTPQAMEPTPTVQDVEQALDAMVSRGGDFAAQNTPASTTFAAVDEHAEEGTARVVQGDVGAAYNIALFVWLISHQPAVLFSQNNPATSNQPAVPFSHNKPAPAKRTG
jgi:hypothetical protein